jgi:SsrA-binding protein
MKLLSNNPKAKYEYTILETFEVGIKLVGSEVKPILKAKANIKGSFAKIVLQEVFLFGMYVPNEETTYHYLRHKEDSERKLLMTKKEIRKLEAKLKMNQHTTLIPLRVYYSDNKKIKVELALCKGKKDYDKRETIKQRDIERYK